jgi:hypothetical protein
METISEEAEQKNLHIGQTQPLLNDGPVPYPKIKSLKVEAGSVLFLVPL